MKKLSCIILSLFVLSAFTISLNSCHKQNCPTYAGSGPTKGAKKALKKSRAAWSKGNTRRDKKTAKGKPMSGL